MAATVVSNTMVTALPTPKARIELSGLTAAETETLSFASGMPNCEVKRVQLVKIKTEPTSNSPVLLGYWASDESNSQFTCKLDTETGGDLAGAVVILEYEMDEQAAQDGTSISTDTDD